MPKSSTKTTTKKKATTGDQPKKATPPSSSKTTKKKAPAKGGVVKKKSPSPSAATKSKSPVKSRKTTITQKSREKSALEKAAAAGVNVDRIEATVAKSKKKAATAASTKKKTEKTDDESDASTVATTKKKKLPSRNVAPRPATETDDTTGGGSYDVVLHEGASRYARSPLYYDAGETLGYEKKTKKRPHPSPKRMPNPLGGESGRGTCLRYGVLRRGGGFGKKLESKGEEFLIELVERMINYCRTKDRVIITPNIACAALKRMGISTVDSYV